MADLKKIQVRQENWSTVIEVIFLLIVAASSYTYVYVSNTLTYNFLHVPLFFLLNLVMLYSVAKMRFAIKSMPNLFPSENLIFIHICLFSVTTVLWIVERVYTTRTNKTQAAYFENPSEENYNAWFYASYDWFVPQLAYSIVDTVLNLFML